MKRWRYRSTICAAMLLGLTAALAQAQITAPPLPAYTFKGPDFLQSLGVGSRSVAMGSAFSALADDASATFWNPGRLSAVRGNQFLLNYRNVINDRENISNASDEFGARPGDLRPSFAGLVYPLTSRRRYYDAKNDRLATSEKYLGHLSVSYALGGYYNVETQSNTLTDPVQTQTFNSQTVREEFTTLAYGNRFDFGKKGRLGVGAGLILLEQDYHNVNVNQSKNIATGLPVNTGVGLNKNSNNDNTYKGSGTGYIAGLSYGFGPEYRQLRFAVTYRPKIGLDYGSTALGPQSQGRAFAYEIPSRTSVGVAYESDWGSKGDQVRLAAEGQFFSTANQNIITYLDQNTNDTVAVQPQDTRKAIANLHLGFEFVPTTSPLRYLFGRGNFAYPLRIGFHTNDNAAYKYTYYTNVVSMGFGVLGRDRNNNTTLSFEPSVEILTTNGMVLWNLSASARF